MTSSSVSQEGQTTNLTHDMMACSRRRAGHGSLPYTTLPTLLMLLCSALLYSLPSLFNYIRVDGVGLSDPPRPASKGIY